MTIPYQITGFGSESTFIISVNVSIRRILRQLHRINGFRLIKRKSWWITDDYYCIFEIRGVQFKIETPLSDYFIEAVGKECPIELFDEIKRALDRPESLLSRLL